MSDNGEDEEAGPVVELGDGPDVEGAPVSRVASRLFFPIEESEVLRREGETTIRTPDGPQTVADVLERSDEVYFETNADLVNTVRSVVGTGPVPTAGGGGGSSGSGADDSEPETGSAETSDPDSEEGPEGAGAAEDEEVAEDAETAESPGTEPDEDAGTGDADTDAEADAADEGEFEFDEE